VQRLVRLVIIGFVLVILAPLSTSAITGKRDKRPKIGIGYREVGQSRQPQRDRDHAPPEDKKKPDQPKDQPSPQPSPEPEEKKQAPPEPEEKKKEDRPSESRRERNQNQPEEKPDQPDESRRDRGQTRPQEEDQPRSRPEEKKRVPEQTTPAKPRKAKPGERSRTDSSRPLGIPEKPQQTLPVITPREHESLNRAFGNRDIQQVRDISQKARIREVPVVVLRDTGVRALSKILRLSNGDQQRSLANLRSRLRDWNRGETAKSKRPDRDAVGNPIPLDTIVIDRRNLAHIRVRYDRITRTLGGPPSHQFLFSPQKHYDQGKDHDQDEDWDERDNLRLFMWFFFYPYYHSDQYWFGFDSSGYYPSIYSLWGWCPDWIYPHRVHYLPFDCIYRDCVNRRTAAVLDYRGVDNAIGDITTAWTDADLDRFLDHLTGGVDIRIYFDNQYSYTVSTEDFAAMTADIMSTTAISSIRFDKPVWISPKQVFVSGHQTSVDPNGFEHQLFLSYRLRKLGSDWYIVAFGSSERPISSQYRDFRNR